MAISTYLTDNDQQRLKKVLINTLSSDDVGILSHSIRGLTLLGHDFKEKESICNKLQKKLDKATLEALFQIGKASAALSCPTKLPTQSKDKLEAALSSSSVAELYYAAEALTSFGFGLESPKVLKALNAALVKDDKIASLGQAFHVASLLDGDVTSVFNRIEDAIVQADQVISS